MHRSIYWFSGLIILVMVLSCSKQRKANYLPVGDIEFDPSTDNPDFKTCGRIFQYYNFEKGNFSLDKKSIRQHFKSRIKKVPGASDQNGYITIRFIVNCQGETDRFRVYEIDRDWKESEFDEELRNQLLMLTKELKGWQPGEFLAFRNRPGKFDFYQYLTFKIRDGEVTDILP